VHLVLELYTFLTTPRGTGAADRLMRTPVRRLFPGLPDVLRKARAN
jgi:hypothetical protein